MTDPYRPPIDGVATYCEHCPIGGGTCAVCETEHPPSPYRDDPYLAIADDARDRFAAGEAWRDNPYPPGSRAYMEWGGAMLDQTLERR